MSNDRFTDAELGEKYGFRGHGTAIFEPQEHGYRCPKGHAHLTWSEFQEHIWCYECEKDYHYAEDCIMIENEYMPELPMKPRIIRGIPIWDKTGNWCVDIQKGKKVHYAQDSTHLPLCRSYFEGEMHFINTDSISLVTCKRCIAEYNKGFRI